MEEHTQIEQYGSAVSHVLKYVFAEETKTTFKEMLASLHVTKKAAEQFCQVANDELSEVADLVVELVTGAFDAAGRGLDAPEDVLLEQLTRQVAERLQARHNRETDTTR